MRVYLFIGIACAAVLGGLVWVTQAPAPEASAPLLQVSGGRGRLGLELTNRERQDVSRCDVTADDGYVEWVASIEAVIPSQATVPVRFESFRAEGQAMPGSVAVSQRVFTVSCLVDGERRSAQLRF